MKKFSPKLNFSIKATPKEILNYWANIFHGDIIKNKLILKYGFIEHRTIDFMNALLVNVHSDEDIEINRDLTDSDCYSIVVSKKIRSFNSQSGDNEVISRGFIFTNINGKTVYPSGDLYLLAIHIPKKEISTLTAGYPNLEKKITHENAFFFEGKLSHDCASAFNKLFDINLNQNFSKAYIWNILAEVIEQSASGNADKYHIPTDGLSKIILAEQKLIENITTPPNMQKIAKECGVSYSYLRKYFRIVYKMPMYKYYQKHRMNYARKLIREKDMNVTEAAYTVGYNHIGHFSDEYKKCFGILPKDDKKQNI